MTKIYFKGDEVRQIFLDKENKLDADRGEKYEKKLAKERKAHDAKLEKIEKLRLKLEKAEKDLKQSDKNEPRTSKSNEENNEKVQLLNSKTKCCECKAIYGKFPTVDQVKWIGCESCSSWSCNICLPDYFKPSDEFLCIKCENKEN